MGLTVAQIVADADSRVPNSVSDSEKVTWLNTLHTEFFESVLVPAVASASTTAGTMAYTLSGPVRARKIVTVHVGAQEYASLLHESRVRPGRNYWTFGDDTGTLTLAPAPAASGQLIVVKYGRIPETTFTTADMATQTPDAPEEYHYAFVLGLCARIAEVQKDVSVAANYDAQWRAALAVAAQNLALRG